MRCCPHVHGLVFSLALLTACAATSPRQPIRSAMIGTYRFDQRVSEDTQIVGKFTVEADTVLMDADSGPCRQQSTSSYFSYTCGTDVIYRFDRSNPVGFASYIVTVQVKKTRKWCRNFTVSSTGQTVCAEFGNEVYYQNERRSGALRATRVTDTM